MVNPSAASLAGRFDDESDVCCSAVSADVGVVAIVVGVFVELVVATPSLDFGVVVVSVVTEDDISFIWF